MVSIKNDTSIPWENQGGADIHGANQGNASKKNSSSKSPSLENVASTLSQEKSQTSKDLKDTAVSKNTSENHVADKVQRSVPKDVLPSGAEEKGSQNPSDEELLKLIKFDTRFSLKYGSVLSKKYGATGYNRSDYLKLLRTVHQELIIEGKSSVTLFTQDEHGNERWIVASISQKSKPNEPHITLYEWWGDILGEGGVGTVSTGTKLSTGRAVALKQAKSHFEDASTEEENAEKVAKAIKNVHNEAKKTLHINSLIKQRQGELQGKYPELFYSHEKSDGSTAITCTAVQNIKEFDEKNTAFISNRGTPLTQDRSDTTTLLSYPFLERLDIPNHIAQSVEFLHDVGYLLVDVKTDNILMQRLHNGKDVPVLIDIGEAMALDPLTLIESILKQEQLVIGTPTYSSELELHAAQMAIPELLELGGEQILDSLFVKSENFFYSYHDDPQDADTLQAFQELKNDPLFPHSLQKASMGEVVALLDNGQGNVKSLADKSVPLLRKEVLQQFINQPAIKEKIDNLYELCHNIQCDATALTLLEIVDPKQFDFMVLTNTVKLPGASAWAKKRSLKEFATTFIAVQPNATAEQRQKIIEEALTKALEEHPEANTSNHFVSQIRSLVLQLLSSKDDKQTLLTQIKSLIAEQNTLHK